MIFFSIHELLNSRKHFLFHIRKPDDIEERINTWDILHFRPGIKMTYDINIRLKKFQNGRVETFFISDEEWGS